jgi:hypothetical protein
MTAVDVNPNGNENVESDAPDTPKARLVSVTVQLEVVADEGGAMLHPLNIAPVKVRAADWSAFDLQMQLADVQKQLDQGTPLR